MEQWPQITLLRLPVVQGRSPCQPQEGLEEGCRREHHLPDLPHHRLLNWMLRFQEQQRGQFPPQMEGIPLESGKAFSLFSVAFVLYIFGCSSLGLSYLFDSFFIFLLVWFQSLELYTFYHWDEPWMYYFHIYAVWYSRAFVIACSCAPSFSPENFHWLIIERSFRWDNNWKNDVRRAHIMCCPFVLHMFHRQTKIALLCGNHLSSRNIFLTPSGMRSWVRSLVI